ncbi:helix-turn-helix domain-containing protein [Microbacterium gorillae]|uniref:helix-turn-helix domain-containing protein n=1 Tax=Microbacterium gorillae TaxID=1231063 RepID=UPI003D9698FE
MPDTSTSSITIAATDRRGLGGMLADRRRALGMTQRELEFASGVPQGKISRVERGQSYPALLTLTQIAGALGLELVLTIQDVPST